MPEAMLMFVHALTSLHAGSGTALGVVDLPVQRERHTGWPTIAGTSLKGVLRAEARSRMDKATLAAVFGPDAFGPNAENAADHAGAISFTDARLLAFPVRSLKGVFAWVTCPAALARLNRDLNLTALAPPPTADLAPAPNTAFVTKDSPLRQGDGLVLEEFAFEARDAAEPIVDWIAEHAVVDAATRQWLKGRLVIVDDDAFSHFAQHATEVTARIALDYETKTVREGALFYEEFLPPETLLYSVVLADRSRSKTKMTASEVLDALAGLGLRTVQIGAGETIGKGLCALHFARPNGAAR
jgi:CRISPR-associated protein Cmr4